MHIGPNKEAGTFAPLISTVFPQNKLSNLTSFSNYFLLPMPSSLTIWHISRWDNPRACTLLAQVTIFKKNFLLLLFFTLYEVLTISKLKSTWYIKLSNNCPECSLKYLAVTIRHRCYTDSQTFCTKTVWPSPATATPRGWWCLYTLFGRKRSLALVCLNLLNLFELNLLPFMILSINLLHGTFQWWRLFRFHSLFPSHC